MIKAYYSKSLNDFAAGKRYEYDVYLIIYEIYSKLHHQPWQYIRAISLYGRPWDGFPKRTPHAHVQFEDLLDDLPTLSGLKMEQQMREDEHIHHDILPTPVHLRVYYIIIIIFYFFFRNYSYTLMCIIFMCMLCPHPSTTTRKHSS